MSHDGFRALRGFLALCLALLDCSAIRLFEASPDWLIPIVTVNIILILVLAIVDGNWKENQP